MLTIFPLWVLALDYLLGVVMWTLIGRFGMSIFLRPDHPFFFHQFFIRVTDPLLNFFAPVTPKFLVRPLVPLYVAWFFYLARFYLLPYLFDYGAMGMLSFPLESEFAQQIAAFIGLFTF